MMNLDETRHMMGFGHARPGNLANTAGGGRAARGHARAKRFWIFCLAIAALLAPATVSPASVELSIQVTGLSFSYNESPDGSLFDGTVNVGGHGLIGEATQVPLIDFFLGGKKVGSLLSSDPGPYHGLYCDFLVHGIYNIPKIGGTVTTTSTGASFGFDLLSSSLGEFLALDLDTATVSYTKSLMSLKFSFTAGGPSAGLLSQDLPFGLVIDPGQLITVTVSSSSVSNRTEDSTYVTAFSTTGGTAVVDGVQVPEPVSFAILLGMGVIGLEFRARRKRRPEPATGVFTNQVT